MKSKKINNYIYNLFKDLYKDERGSILPMIAVVLILVIIIGSVNFALVVMYRDRAVVRNAIDAAATSSLAASAVEKKKAITYGETLVTTKTEFIKCIQWEEVGVDEDGEPINEEFDNSFYSPREQVWQNTESEIKNYIQLNIGQAEAVAKEYFEKNMKGNSIKYNIKSWNYDVTYDDKRMYKVEKNRTIIPIRPAFTPGREPSGANCDAGVPDIYNEVKNPETWWSSDFSGANTGFWSSPPGWTDSISEEREVIFPRWVEVNVKVTVELPVPFGDFLGKITYKANFDVTAFKELIYAIP